MRLEKLCSMDGRYLDAHFPDPYEDESEPGWGVGEGTITGERLSGTIKWSNHPSTLTDGVRMTDLRGLYLAEEQGLPSPRDIRPAQLLGRMEIYLCHNDLA